MKQKILSYLLVILFFALAHGKEFQVNNRTSLSQANVDVAAGPNGRFYTVWSSYFGTAGRSNDIICRIFEPNCAPTGDEFQINQTVLGNQTEPSIAVKKPTGDFIVVWQGPGLIEEDGEDIFAQWIDANGLPLGDEIHINNINLQKDQVCPKIAMNDSGSYVLVWESESPNTEPNTTIICCRQYDSGGKAIGNEFQVNNEPDCRYPDVAIDPNGNFTVVWIEGNRPNFSVMARLYDSNGISITEPFKVSTIPITSFSQPEIAMDATGCFLITWDGDPNLARLDDIHCRLYEPNGVPKGEQFTVNSTLENAQQNPQAAMNDLGQFVIIWDSEGDPNVNQKDILGQRFNSSGVRLGGEFRLNSYTDSDQKSPAVAILEDGRFVAVWQSLNQDTSNYGIFGEIQEMISAADFNIDGYVNFLDYSILAAEWHLSTSLLVSDLIDDTIIDECDLYVFCQKWLNLSNR